MKNTTLDLKRHTDASHFFFCCHGKIVCEKQLRGGRVYSGLKFNSTMHSVRNILTIIRKPRVLNACCYWSAVLLHTVQDPRERTVLPTRSSHINLIKIMPFRHAQKSISHVTLHCIKLTVNTNQIPNQHMKRGSIFLELDFKKIQMTIPVESLLLLASSSAGKDVEKWITGILMWENKMVWETTYHLLKNKPTIYHCVFTLQK